MHKKISIQSLAVYFLILGTIGFGGSVALAHTMQKDLVEKKKWLTHEEFLQGLTLSQLAPGPLAAQLAMYIGYVRREILGATVAGIAFVVPSFVMVTAIAIVYARFGEISFIRGALYGIGAAVIGIIAASGYALTKRTMQKKLLLWILYLAVLVITIFTNGTNIWMFLIPGIITLFVYTKEPMPKPQKEWTVVPFVTFLPSLFAAVTAIPLVNIFLFFFIAGSIAFGGGLAIVPFLQHGVVTQYHWLNHKQFVDAVSVAMITPGPVVIAATFIGFLAGSFPGAILATLAIFLPVYLIVIVFTPLFSRHAKHPRMVAFVEGVIAAAMASIAGAVVLLGKEAITDMLALSLAVIAFIAAKFFKIPGIFIVLIAGSIGIIFH